MSYDLAKTSDVNDLVKRLQASGLFPPWKTDDENPPARVDVVRLWLAQAQAREVTGKQLLGAVDRWLLRDPPSGGPRRWPAPGDVLSLVVRGASSTGESCGLCNENGFRHVALHLRTVDDQVVVHEYAIHCDCVRGRQAADRQTQPNREGGAERPRPLQLGTWLDRMRDRPSYLAAFVDPTPAQRRPGCPSPSPGAEARARAIVARMEAAAAARRRPRPELPRGPVDDEGVTW